MHRLRPLLSGKLTLIKVYADLSDTSGFFMITKRQLLTIEHLETHQGITESDDIIEYCLGQLAKPFKADDFMRHKRTGEPRLPKSKTRKRGKGYYQKIIEYCLNL